MEIAATNSIGIREKQIIFSCQAFYFLLLLLDLFLVSGDNDVSKVLSFRYECWIMEYFAYLSLFHYRNEFV